MRSDKTLKRWYSRINKRFFSASLPVDVCVRWANEEEEKELTWEEKYFGWTTNNEKEGHDSQHHSYTIVLSRTKHGGAHYCRPHSTILSTLAHEMCHVATQLKDDHGPAFEKWRQKIADKGFFKKGALLKGLTTF